MDFWNEQADQLELALLGNVSALLLHFLRTAPGEAIAALAGKDFAQASPNERAAVTALLVARLDQPAAHAASQVFRPTPSVTMPVVSEQYRAFGLNEAEQQRVIAG